MLKQRIYTALILVLAVLLLLFYSSSNVFAVILAIIMMLAVSEWCNLIKIDNLGGQILVMFVLAAIFVSIYYYQPN